jgi:predicted nucleotidyltransferase
MTNASILIPIKSQIEKVVPLAKVFLFGSRVCGTQTEESDWDILIITPQPVSRDLKKDIHDVLFPLSVQIGAFINTFTVQEYDWNNNPSYYSLRQTTIGRMLQI